MAEASRYDELEKLAALRDRGALSDEEFAEQKAKVLSGPEPVQHRPASVPKRIFAAVVWTLAFWTGGLFVVGAVAGVMDPENAAEAGEAAGQAYSGIIFLLSLAGAAAGAVTRKLPMTR